MICILYHKQLYNQDSGSRWENIVLADLAITFKIKTKPIPLFQRQDPLSPIMKIVIQCSSRKNGEWWTLSEYNGLIVKFVAHPEACNEVRGVLFCRPDDTIPNELITWREYLCKYNQKGTNPDGLHKAAELYNPDIYRNLVDAFGWENVFILSAGWGLVRSDFLLPKYDITFSLKASIYTRRNNNQFNDYIQLTQSEKANPDDQLYFFGGSNYLPVFYKLTENIEGEKIVYYNSSNITKRDGYKLIKYKTKRRTNWHYSCAEDFINGKL
jgi:hypothetical protein